MVAETARQRWRGRRPDDDETTTRRRRDDLSSLSIYLSIYGLYLSIDLFTNQGYAMYAMQRVCQQALCAKRLLIIMWLHFLVQADFVTASGYIRRYHVRPTFVNVSIFPNNMEIQSFRIFPNFTNLLELPRQVTDSLNLFCYLGSNSSCLTVGCIPRHHLRLLLVESFQTSDLSPNLTERHL